MNVYIFDMGVLNTQKENFIIFLRKCFIVH
jgi:hypothetical protein